jgi:hypothetical protein
MNSLFPSPPVAGARVNFPDEGMNIDYFVTNDVEVCVMHDRPFAKTLSWVEYDIASSRLDLIMEDGDIRNFGIPVAPHLKAYFMNTQTVYVIQLNLEDHAAEATLELPLIVHNA